MITEANATRYARITAGLCAWGLLCFIGSEIAASGPSYPAEPPAGWRILHCEDSGRFAYDKPSRYDPKKRITASFPKDTKAEAVEWAWDMFEFVRFSMPVPKQDDCKWVVAP